MYAMAVATGKWCTAATNETPVRYAGTVAVVQDMLYFTELQAALNGKKPEDALIWYYGVSYGTVIGQTLAALYPNRIGRVIVDANVNGQDYYEGMLGNAVEDTDDAMLYFFKTCYEAGTKGCKFAGNSGSAKDIEKRFNDLLAKLEKEPLQAILPSFRVPSIITKTDVLKKIFGDLYAPSATFHGIAYGLDGLEKGNASAWFYYLSETSSVSDPGPFNYTGNAASDAFRFIMAVDAAGRYPLNSVEDWVQTDDKIEKTSQWFGKGYTDTNPLVIAGMKVIPPKSQLFTGNSSLLRPKPPMTAANCIAQASRRPKLASRSSSSTQTPTQSPLSPAQNTCRLSSKAAPSWCRTRPATDMPVCARIAPSAMCRII
jgi:hypothetical protein